MNIGDVIASIRRRKRIDQQELATRLSISVGYLSLIENGHRKPSNKLLKNIADQLQVPVASLVFMVFEEGHFSEEKKELFNATKPIMADIIDFLLALDTDDAKPNRTAPQKGASPKRPMTPKA